jgi:hypothetical protein
MKILYDVLFVVSLFVCTIAHVTAKQWVAKQINTMDCHMINPFEEGDREGSGFWKFVETLAFDPCFTQSSLDPDSETYVRKH